MSQSDPIILRSFAGGELTPALSVRADLAKYQIGLATCRNFIVQRHGGAANRPGFRFVGSCKTNGANVRLVKFVHETAGESVLIEHGANYFRFWKNGGLVALAGVPAYNGATAYEIGDIVASGGTNYYCIAATTGNAPPNATYWYAMPGAILELPSPFNDPFHTKAVQSGRTIAFTNRDVAPHDLIYVGPTQWVIRQVQNTPKVGAPQNPVLTPGAAGARTFAYIITAAHPVTYEEGLPSAQVVDAACAQPTVDAPNVLTWDVLQVDGVDCPEYYVYCDPYENGTYGYIGTATGAASFNDVGIVPDFSQTPALQQDLFNAATQYPGACGFHQQRRFFANTEETPDAVFGSRVGFQDNFGISSPLQDDDALSFRLAGNNNHAVQWVIGLKRLILMTDGGEWAVGLPNTPLTPSDLAADQETYVGVSDIVQPIIVGNSILYVQARGSIMRELRFDEAVEGLAGKDLTVYAEHLFRRAQMYGADYQQNPNSIVWVVRQDGTLLGLTYLHEHDVFGWHRHDTDGFFEQVCVIPETDEDVLYVVVRRTIGGNTVRYIERLENRDIDDWSLDNFFLDSGLTYDGPATGVVSGLGHLEGKTVGVVADGLYLGTRVVSGGSVSLDTQTASIIHVGLLYNCDLTTLQLDVNGSTVREKRKRVASVTVAVEESSRTFYIGSPTGSWKQYTPGTLDSPQTVRWTGDIEVGNVYSRFEQTGQVFIRQSTPLALTVLGITPHIEVGGGG